ncbi:MAG: 8-amino-7-oxononanoate synthase [Desulfocapsa sp.]|nr:8-amino-7-oxononanoate synthase [Desulfocapsa sp.]
MSRYSKKLQDLEAKGRLRSLKPLGHDGPGIVNYHGRPLLNLSSNDYLGIGEDVLLRETFYQSQSSENADDFRLTAASSRLLAGDSQLAHDLEHDLASAYQSEAALLFNSGYHANIGILPALYGKGDLILSDKLNHASIHDALSLTRADHRRFHHCDYEQVRSLLIKYREQYDQVVIVTESVFSMDGDVADLQHLVELKEKFNAALYVDEAHGIGLYGQKGLGKVEEMGLLGHVDLLVGTFGKGLASIGAFVCCSSEIRNFLINHSRSFIFTTALPPVTLNWNRFVFLHMLGMEEERYHLQQISKQLRLQLQEKGIVTRGSTNIVPILIGEDSRALHQAEAMQQHGFLILPVRPPAVSEGSARFRLSLCANMQWQDLQALPELLAAMRGAKKSEK